MYTVYSLIISVYSVSLTHESNIPGTGPLGHWGTGSRSNDLQGAPPKWITGPPGQSSGTSGEHQQSATNLCFSNFRVCPIGFTKTTKKPLGKPMKSPLHVRIWGSRCSHISRTPCCIMSILLETREPAMLYSSRVASSSSSSTPL